MQYLFNLFYCAKKNEPLFKFERSFEYVLFMAVLTIGFLNFKYGFSASLNQNLNARSREYMFKMVGLINAAKSWGWGGLKCDKT